MSTLEDAQAHAQACLSEIGETASLFTEAKTVADEHIQLSAGVGAEWQINGGTALASGCEDVLSGLATVMNDVEAVSLQAQMLQD